MSFVEEPPVLIRSANQMSFYDGHICSSYHSCERNQPEIIQIYICTPAVGYCIVLLPCCVSVCLCGKEREENTDFNSIERFFVIFI